MYAYITTIQFSVRLPNMAKWLVNCDGWGYYDCVWYETPLAHQAEAILAKIPRAVWTELYEEDGDDETTARLAKLAGVTDDEMHTLLCAGRVLGGG